MALRSCGFAFVVAVAVFAARTLLADSILIPASAFDRGNVRTIASGSYADGEPVVVNGGVTPNFLEFDVDLPIAAVFSFHLRYAAAESRPVDILVDGKKIARGCRSTSGSWQSSSAIWEKVCDSVLEQGQHTLRLECPGPCIPHIVALRLDTSAALPAGWRLERPNARKLDLRLGDVEGPAKDRDGFEAFVREDGTVAVPDSYNPIVRFKRRDPKRPMAERLLERLLTRPQDPDVQVTVVPSARGDGSWEARLEAKAAQERVDAATLPLSEALVRQQVERSSRLVAGFRAHRGAEYLGPELSEIESLDCALEAWRDDTGDGEARWRSLYDLHARAFVLGNRIARTNPLLLDALPLVFVRRKTYDTSHIYTTYFDGSHRLGGSLCVLDEARPDATPRAIATELGDHGLFRDPDVSWDGRRVVFSFKPKEGAPNNIYEVAVDGTGLRRLTDSPAEDIDPAYLPDGRIVFISTRVPRFVLCHNTFTVSVLHVMEADGSSPRCISANTVNEFTPSVAADGGILYTRWEYVDKNVGNNQSLWRARPDGSFATHVAGAHWGPITFWEPRQVPHSRLIVCTLAPHMPIAAGPIALVDPLEPCRSPAAFENLTPELPPPHHAGWHRSDVGYSMNPFPLSENWFVVSYSFDADPEAPAGYGLYLLDRSGHRDIIYRDAEISTFEAIPAVPRARPASFTRSAGGAEAEGTFIVLDVYEGLPGVERGAVKRLRVVEEVPKPAAASCQGFGLQHPVVSRDGNFAVKRHLGSVAVEADGSAHFRAPAGKALYFAALDEDGLEIQRMRSFISLEPGQTVTCIGCHEDRKSAPPNRHALATARAPSQLLPPPEGVHAPDFARDVQPVLDQHCGSCHAGERIDGGVDLSSDSTNLFNVAYETLTNGWVSSVSLYSSANLALSAPRSLGSPASKLVRTLRGEHRQHVEVPHDALRRIAEWIDLNAPYYGTYQLSRPGTVGGQELVSGAMRAALDGVHRRRCASCHGADSSRARRVRVPGITRSPSLCAPLAKKAGGSGACTPVVFHDASDPDYQSMLHALESLREEVAQNPRVDRIAERPAIAGESTGRIR